MNAIDWRMKTRHGRTKLYNRFLVDSFKGNKTGWTQTNLQKKENDWPL